MTIHPALDESELYDDPEERKIVAPFPPPIYVPPPSQGPSHVVTEEPAKPDSYLKAVNAAMDILSYRVILLLSVLVAGGLFGLATWNPDPWRLGAAAAFSIIVVAPLTFFYARR